MKRIYSILAVTGVLVVMGGRAMMLFTRPTETPNDTNKQNPKSLQQIAPTTSSSPEQSLLEKGVYSAYAQNTVRHEGYTDTILFFHAPWCPECRAYDMVLSTMPIPDGVQILKVDYDSSTDLRKKYGVTIQTTFVKINHNGDKLSLWPAYGKEKTIDAIIDNT